MNQRLQQHAEKFFNDALSICSTVPAKTDFVVVTHLLEDRPWFLRAVSQLGKVIAVIPKKKSTVPRIRDVLQYEYPLVDASRAELSSANDVDQWLSARNPTNSVCILDIGGYFASGFAGVGRSSAQRIAGVVEDTENGHRKYENAIKGVQAHAPVASVARSVLKRPENFLVGQSLVYSVEAILRGVDELLHGRQATVIGYGNIGRSVAQHLHERHVTVTVYDRDPIKMIEAFTHGYVTASSAEEAVSNADIVFCVTGNRSIGLNEINAMRPHAYVATVTSPDDELQPEVLELYISHRPQNISEYRRKDGSTVYLMNRGQAVNFLHGSVVGPFIQLLQAEMLVTASQLLAGVLPPRPGEIVSIDRATQEQIAHAWLKVYKH